MNRTLLLFIVDFLFLNLIALTRWERSEPSRPKEAPVNQIAANAVSRDQDLVDTMRQSLADEELARKALEEKLDSSGATLAVRERTIGELSSGSQKLTAQLVDAQKAKADIAVRYESATRESDLAKSQLEQLRRELEEKRAEAERQRLAAEAFAKQAADARGQIEGLRVQVAVGEQEKQLLTSKAADLEQQVGVERTERARVEQSTSQLAQGVGQLAQNSGELSKEIRDYRPVPANVLFNDFLSSRVGASFTATRKGLLSKVVREKEADTILVTDGKQVYALLEIEDTPFSLREVGSDWQKAGVRLAREAGISTEAEKVTFLRADPRVVAIPLTEGQVATLGAKVYPLASDRFRFPEALLISRDGKGYGELGFKLDPGHPGYVRVDNRFFKRLFGDFSTSSGDLVLSQAGELLGVMVNNDYCLLLDDFTPSAEIGMGDDVTRQHTGTLIDSLSARVLGMPLELQ
jgi:hypothetical protein